jgi:hypothetical protein
MEVDGTDGRVVGGGVAVFGFELEAFCSEIEKKAVFDLGGGEIIDQLNGVGDGEGIDGLEFYNQFILDDNIRLKDAYFLFFVENRQNGMDLELDLRLSEFDCQGFPVDRFDKPTAQRPVYLHRQANNLPRQQLVWCKFLSFLIHKFR